MDTVYSSQIVPEYLQNDTLRNRAGVLDAPPSVALFESFSTSFFRSSHRRRRGEKNH